MADEAGTREGADALLSVRRLTKQFMVRNGFSKQQLRAVDDVSFELRRGETLAIVGESGSGKSTLARAITRLTEPTSGEVWLGNRNLLSLSREEMRRTRKEIQLVFQDPYASLNPRQRIADIVAESLRIHRLAASKNVRAAEAMALLERVGLRAELGQRYPHELSGGQRQRGALARALAVSPKLIVFDEAVSALDVSIQAQMLNLIRDLQERLHLSFLFITHDLSVARHVATHVAVMYLGEIVEYGEADRIFGQPQHPYTRELLSAVPVPGERGASASGIRRTEAANPIAPPSGCRFRARCPQALPSCAITKPEPVHAPVGSHYWTCLVSR